MIVVETRTPTEENAVDIAKAAIEKNLAIGGSIYKSREVYQWGDTVRDDKMYVLQIGANADNLQDIIALIKELNDDKEPSITFNGVAADAFSEEAAVNNGFTKVSGKIYGGTNRDN